MIKKLAFLLTTLVMVFTLHIAVAQPVETNITEIVVTGSLPGPPLWQVANGNNKLWIFASLTPLPKGLDWDSSRVEQVIANADEYLEAPTVEPEVVPVDAIKLFRMSRMESKMEKLQRGIKLEDILEESLYQRMLTSKEEYGPRGNGLFQLRPAYAAEELRNSAFKKNKLVDSSSIFEKRIKRLVRRYSVPTTRSYVGVDISENFEAISEFLTEEKSLPDEISCLNETLDMIESDLSGAQERAHIWAHGNMGELYSSRFTERERACNFALNGSGIVQEVFNQSYDLWILNAEKALEDNEITFGILPMKMLIDRDGLLERLRDKGYEIIEP